MFILDLKSPNGTGVYIYGGAAKFNSISFQSTFETFSNLTSLKVFLDPKIGKTFTFSDISGDLSNILIESLISLSDKFGLGIQGNIKASLTLLVKISLSISTLIKGSLKGFLDASGKGLIKLHGDFVWLGGVLEGLGVLFGNINGGLATLIAAKVKFDLSLIFGSRNGLELFINILFPIAAKGKITLLAGLLNCTDKLLALIVQLGGNVSTGVTGVFKIILYINVLIRGEIEFKVFLKTLLEFAASRTSQKSIHLQIYIDALTKLVDISKASSSKELTEFVTWVNNLQAGKLFKGKLNISEIIVILVSGSVTNALVLVISVLLKLKVIVGFGIAVTIPALLFYLVLQLISPHGLSLLKSLGIEIKEYITPGDVISGLTKGNNIQSILSILGGRFDVEKLGRVFPPFGQIYHSVSVALRTSSNGSYDLSTLVKSSSVQNDLSVIIKGIVDLALTTNEK
nr:uncharacterized protein LOC111503489 [Leptinotarsa decemlineata]